jgi:hypothetical protein
LARHKALISLVCQPELWQLASERCEGVKAGVFTPHGALSRCNRQFSISPLAIA